MIAQKVGCSTGEHVNFTSTKLADDKSCKLVPTRMQEK